MEKQLLSKNKLLEKAKIKKNLSFLIGSNRKVRFLEKKLEASKCDVENLQNTVHTLKEKYEAVNAEKSQIAEELKELSISIDYLQGLLENDTDLYVYDPDQNKYTNELAECAINLTKSNKFKSCIKKRGTSY